MPKVVVSDAKGLVQETGKGVIGLLQSKTEVLTLKDSLSQKISLPAGSLITAYHVVLTETITNAAAGNVTVKVGSAADNDTFAAAVTIDDVAGSTIGKGTSTEAEVQVALQGAAPLVQKVGTPFIENDDDVFFIFAEAGGGAFTAGKASVTVEFITFS